MVGGMRALAFALLGLIASLRADDPRKIRVVVVDHKQQAIAGVRIVAHMAAGKMDGVTTDGSGVAEFTADPSIHSVELRREGFAETSVHLDEKQTEVRHQMLPVSSIQSSVRAPEGLKSCDVELLQVKIEYGLVRMYPVHSLRSANGQSIAFEKVMPGRYFVKWICHGKEGMLKAVYPDPSGEGMNLIGEDRVTPELELEALRAGSVHVRLEPGEDHRERCAGELRLEPVTPFDGGTAQTHGVQKDDEGACIADLSLAEGMYRLTYGKAGTRQFVQEVRVEADRETQVRSRLDGLSRVSLIIERVGIETEKFMKIDVELVPRNGGAVAATQVERRAGQWEFQGLRMGRYRLIVSGGYRAGELRCGDRVNPSGLLEVAPGESLYCRVALHAFDGKMRMSVGQNLRGKWVSVLLLDAMGDVTLRQFDQSHETIFEITDQPIGRAWACTLTGIWSLDLNDALLWERVKRSGTEFELRRGEVAQGELRSCGP